MQISTGKCEQLGGTSLLPLKPAAPHAILWRTRTVGKATHSEVPHAAEATCQYHFEALCFSQSTQPGTASSHQENCDTQLKPYIQYTSLEANAILETSGRGSFIAPAVGFLHYGPSCYLYDHVCNFNYQGEHMVCPAHSYNSQCHWPFQCPSCSALSFSAR